MFRLLLLACCCPSLSSAWCSGLAGGVVGVASKRAGAAAVTSSLPPVNNVLHADAPFHRSLSTRKRTTDRFKLWSVPNGGGDDTQDGDAVVNNSAPANTVAGSDGAGGEKMTLQKASKLLSTFWSMAFPYYQESQPGRRLFYGMILLTLLNSGVSVAFSYISKDFWNALSSKDTAEFYSMMLKFAGALVVGAPVAVFYR